MIYLWEKKVNLDILKYYFENYAHPEEFLFFDIETTDLAFTKSNLIFLIGIGYLMKDKFFIKQFILEDKEEEIDIYNLVLGEIKHLRVLFTYNGEKFDIPLLINRLKMYNLEEHINVIKSFIHIDLLKISRKLWKSQIKSCTLGNVEKRILKIERKEDLPGFLVPSFYERFIKQRDMKYLNKILEHNKQDILSLYYILENIIREDLVNDRKGNLLPIN